MQVTGKNIEVSALVREYIDRKLGKLNRYLTITDLIVELSEEKTRNPQQRYIVQVTLDSSGTILRGEERAEDLLAAVDKVAAVIERQIERYRGKRADKKGSQTVRTAEPEIKLPKIVKVKHFAVRQLSREDAAEQMELLGHDFFLFINRDDDKLNLLYRRKDGDYGLIEPENQITE